LSAAASRRFVQRITVVSRVAEQVSAAAWKSADQPRGDDGFRDVERFDVPLAGSRPSAIEVVQLVAFRPTASRMAPGRVGILAMTADVERLAVDRQRQLEAALRKNSLDERQQSQHFDGLRTPADRGLRGERTGAKIVGPVPRLAGPTNGPIVQACPQQDADDLRIEKILRPRSTAEDHNPEPTRIITSRVRVPCSVSSFAPQTNH